MINDAKVDTGKDCCSPGQIYRPQEETLIREEENPTHMLYDQVEVTNPAVTGHGEAAGGHE